MKKDKCAHYKGINVVWVSNEGRCYSDPVDGLTNKECPFCGAHNELTFPEKTPDFTPLKLELNHLKSVIAGLETQLFNLSKSTPFIMNKQEE